MDLQNDEPFWLIFVFVPLYIFIFVVLVELSRRYRVFQVSLYWIMPFILIPILFVYSHTDHGNDEPGTFDYIKLFSVIFAAWMVQLVRHQLPKWREKDHNRLTCILVWTVGFVLMANIGEAVYYEFTLKNVFPGNAICGAILMLTQANATNIKQTNDGYSSVQWELSSSWILVYTVWNFIFVHNFFCYEIFRAVYHCLFPLIFVIWTDWNQWVQHRTYALCLFKWINCLPTLKYWLPFWILPELSCDTIPYNEWFELTLHIISFMLGVMLLFKDMYDEYKFWDGRAKPKDTSLIQWFMEIICCKKQKADYKYSDVSDVEESIALASV